MNDAPARRLLAAFGLLTLAACTRDLELPAVPTRPEVTDFTPRGAYAGQLIRVSGTHFDANAAANTVDFPLASARGERFEGGNLVVRVPPDAGSGAITVGSPTGTSAPSAATFDYRGLGQPRRGQVVSSVPLLHHPRRVHSVYGTLFLESRLYGTSDGALDGLVRYGAGSTGPDPFVSASAAARWRNLLVYTVDDATGTKVTLVDQVGGTAKTVHLADVHPWRLVPVRNALLASGAKDLLVTFQTNTLVGETMAAWAIDDLLALVTVPAIAERTVTLSTLDGTRTLTALTGPVDSGDGRVVAIAAAQEKGPVLGIAGIAFSVASQSFFVTPPAGRTIDAKLTDRYFEGLASGVRDTGVPPTFAFALDGGRVGLLDGGTGLDQATADANTRIVGTWSASPLGGLSFGRTATATPQLVAVATKPGDDLVLGVQVSLSPGTTPDTVAWGLPTRGAARSTIDAGNDAIVHVANDGDDELQVVNVTTGRQVGRIGFDPSPTSIRVADGLAFSPADPLDPLTTDQLYLVAGNPAAVLVHPLGFGQQACAWRSPSEAVLARDPASRTVWGSAAAVPATTAMEIADLSGVSPLFATGAPAGQPVATAFAGGSLVVAHDGGLTAVSGGVVTGTWSPTWTTTAPTFSWLGATSTGDLFAAGSWDGTDRVQLWKPSQITATGSPIASWQAPDYVDWAIWLEDGLWVQHTDLSTWRVSRLALSGTSLGEATFVTPVDPVGFFVGTTPNARALVRWEYRAGGGSALRLFSADPATKFSEIMYVALEGTVAGVAFDSSGEHAYVVTQGPDRIVTID